MAQHKGRLQGCVVETWSWGQHCSDVTPKKMVPGNVGVTHFPAWANTVIFMQHNLNLAAHVNVPRVCIAHWLNYLHGPATCPFCIATLTERLSTLWNKGWRSTSLQLTIILFIVAYCHNIIPSVSTKGHFHDGRIWLQLPESFRLFSCESQCTRSGGKHIIIGVCCSQKMPLWKLPTNNFNLFMWKHIFTDFVWKFGSPSWCTLGP